MHKRRRCAEMAAPTIVMLVSHDTTIQGGGLPWITFLSYALPFEIYGLKREGHQGSNTNHTAMRFDIKIKWVKKILSISFLRFFHTVPF